MFQHFCVKIVRVWRCATHRGARLPPCTAANAVTAFVAPVRQGAARSRAASSGSSSATVGMRGGVLGERAALNIAHAAVESKRRRRAMAGHVRTASSRCPAAAGITHPRQRHARTCLWGCDVSQNFQCCSVPVRCCRRGPFASYSGTAMRSDVES